MAKSRKPNKTADKADTKVEVPQDAENISTSTKPSEIPESEAKAEDALISAETPSEDGKESEPVKYLETDEKASEKADAEQGGLSGDAVDSAGKDAGETADTLAAKDEPETGEKPDTDPDQPRDGSDARVLTEEAPTSDGKDATPWGARKDPQEGSVFPPEPAAIGAPPPEPQVVRGSIWPAVFGGVIAAVIGFIAGRGDMLDTFLPTSMQRTTVDLTAIEEEAARLAAQSEAQAERLAALESVSMSDITMDLSTLSSSIGDLENSVAALVDRVAEVEARPEAPAVVENDGASSEAVEALQAAIDAQNEQIAALAERAEAAEAEAAGEAARLLARAALTRVVTAVDSGESFGPALGDLEQSAPVEVPTALREAAETGVPTMASLQDSFPDAARAGLAAARAEVPEAEVDGITGFLRRQLNARSVTPREGTDADAILSRAQAAVRAADLETALIEMEALPETAQSAMSDWLQAASARKAAQDAAQDLADSLNSN